MNFQKYLCTLALGALCCWSSLAAAKESQAFLMVNPDLQVENVEVERTYSGPTLLFSDSPEMVYQNGILYQDKIQGRVRLFFHHVNAVERNKKLAVVLRNEKMRPLHYKILRQGMAGKTYNYLWDGKESQKRYFAEANPKVKEGKLGFYQSQELLSGKGVILPNNQLYTGTMDLEVDRPALLSVFMCEANANLELFYENAQVQPMDEHPLRGTFPQSDWEYTITKPITGQKPVKLKLASAEEGYIKGVDATTGLPAENYGNYGVVYKVNFTVESRRPVSFIVNPTGGYFAGYGVLEHKGKRQLMAIPDFDLSLGGRVEEAVELCRLKSGQYSFIWSPPGASNLPIELLWAPSRRALEK